MTIIFIQLTLLGRVILLQLKNLIFLKYLFLYLSLRFLLEKDLINLKHLFWSSSVATIFVCLDIFFQFYNGKDIFGFPSKGRKMGGPFGDELIAGGFIQRFSLFSFFLVPLFYSNTKTIYLKILIPILFLIFF